MTITTLNTFVNNLADLTISGVTRIYDGTPANVEPADLPAMFPRAIEMSEDGLTPKTYGGWPNYVVELVILVQEAGLDTSIANHAVVVDLMDNFATAIRKAVSTSTYGRKPLSWTAAFQREVVATREYWAIVCRVEGGA